jgi:adenine-specific DNA-methyltransferase
MSDKFERLKGLLRELFQLDQPDLDFGIYRIMHAKSAEVTQFLDHELLPQVRAAFEQYRPASKAELERELAQAIEQAHGLGVDPETTQKVKDLRKRLSEDAVDLDQLEAEVYDHLYQFFRRYYSEGDFLSKRVYKPGVYAIPYEGEEVKLHWANADQYYIKTSEYLRDYAFRLKPNDERNPMRVHFRVVDATEGEHGNVKPGEGKDRVFILAPGGESGRGFLAVEKVNGQDELVIRFAYRPATVHDWTEEAKASATEAAAAKPPIQAVLSSIAVKAILGIDDPSLKNWITELARPHVKVSGEQADYSRLAGHLNRYTARHTFDYFIHKDLGGFLRRELDFYIKNEVMHLDDVESETAPRVEQYLSKIRVIRKIATKVIDFLAQLEDFQKKLWLKKKFVVETSWCVRLGLIPEEFFPEIVANEAQREEWVKLLAIDTITGDLTRPGYSAPLSTAFLKSQPTLMVNTSLFASTFTAKLLEVFDDLDTAVDGVLIHGENFQALTLCKERYHRTVDCIYIDPPYNTSENTFLYKNNYKDSSWVAMLADRVRRARSMLTAEGVLEVAIDDTETHYLRTVLDALIGKANRVTTIVAEVNPAGQNIRPNTPALSHDYCHVYATLIDSVQMLLRELTDEETASYDESDNNGSFLWDNLRRRGGNSRPTDRPGQWFPLFVCSDSVRVPAMEWNSGAKEWMVQEEPRAGESIVWPIDPKGHKRIWRVNPDGARKGIADGSIAVTTKAGRLEVIKKSYMPEGRKPKTLWKDARHSATTHGTKLLIDLFGQQLFSYPKSVYLVMDCLRYWVDDNALVLDCFAGSGTTGHAVVKLNREDNGNRRFVLAEVGTYFDSVLVPRLKKVAFCSEWKDGKPRQGPTPEDREFGPRAMKVLRLESYEDVLNNLDVHRDEHQQRLLAVPEAEGADGLKEQYLLRYMLDVETRGSPSLLNVDAFMDPTAYKLKVKRPGSDESREVIVDLLETFNWLIGLTVKHIGVPQTLVAEFERDGEGRLQVKEGLLRPAADGPWWFRTVEGTTPDGRKTLVIWRKRPGGETPEGLEKDNLVLNEWFSKSGYSTKDYEFDLIYVNGDNNLENLKTPDDTWKVRLIEEDFHRLMFDVEDV